MGKLNAGKSMEVLPEHPLGIVATRLRAELALTGAREYSTGELFGEAKFLSRSPFRKTPNHLGQEKH